MSTDMEKEKMKDIKTRFFALRNGIVADRLRRSGCPYKIIFGLMVPQMEQVAARCVPSVELAGMLWENRSTRESRMLATMVYPAEEFSIEKAREWAADADTEELTDQLCFRLVRRLDGAESLADESFQSGDVRRRYFALRLLMNLLVIGRLKDVDAAFEMAVAELAESRAETQRVCRQLIDEIDWLRESHP